MSDKETGTEIRLNKYLADSGVASRRQADRMIEEGLVKVNGKKVYELGVKIDPQNDHVAVSGKSVKVVTMKLYIMLHKPPGYLTTLDDPLDRPTIKEFLGKVPVRVFPIGRLDWDSEGLLLLTNDGDFAQRIMSPKSEVTKTYLVKLEKEPTAPQLQKLLRGVSIVGGKVAAKSLEKISRGKELHPWYKIVITEGKNRQIRQMFTKINNDVLKLQRVGIGCLRLGALKKGEMVFLNDTAKLRVFQQDMPEQIREIKTYKGRAVKQSLVRKEGTKRIPNMKKEKELFGD